MCIGNKRDGALVVLHMLLRRKYLGPRLTKLTCLHLLLATLMTICMFLCQCIVSVVEILGGCRNDFLLHGCLQME